MLNTFTVSFFGHREVEDVLLIQEQVERLIKEILSTKEYSEFLVGHNSEFDSLVSSIIHKLKKDFRDDNCCHTLVLPYNTAKYRNNCNSFDQYYDNIEIYKNYNTSHFKALIQLRNRDMIDRSDLIVFYIEHEYGGAYQTYQYAKKKGKSIIIINSSKVN